MSLLMCTQCLSDQEHNFESTRADDSPPPTIHWGVECSTHGQADARWVLAKDVRFSAFCVSWIAVAWSMLIGKEEP